MTATSSSFAQYFFTIWYFVKSLLQLQCQFLISMCILIMLIILSLFMSMQLSIFISRSMS